MLHFDVKIHGKSLLEMGICVSLIIFAKKMSNCSLIKTSHPQIVKFEINGLSLKNQSFEFTSKDQAGRAPLVQKLFDFPFIKKIYVAVNFLAVEKTDMVSWDQVGESLRLFIDQALEEGVLVIQSGGESKKKQAVTLYVESTPNPKVLKFVCNRLVVDYSIELHKDTANRVDHALVDLLFDYDGVESVFVEKNYISVTLVQASSWEGVSNDLRVKIKECLQNYGPIQWGGSNNPLRDEKDDSKESMDEYSIKIIEILDQYIKPAVESDGGNIKFVSYDKKSKLVKVLMQGACHGCPSSSVTLKQGIQTTLRNLLENPELIVEQV